MRIKKALSAVLCAVMLFSAVPMTGQLTASAAETSYSSAQEQIIPSDVWSVPTVPAPSDTEVKGSGPDVITAGMLCHGIDPETNLSTPTYQPWGTLKVNWHAYTVSKGDGGALYTAPKDPQNKNFEIGFVYSEPSKLDNKYYPTLSTVGKPIFTVKYKANKIALDHINATGKGYLRLSDAASTDVYSTGRVLDFGAAEPDKWQVLTYDLSNESAYGRTFDTLPNIKYLGLKPLADSGALPEGAELTIAYMAFLTEEEANTVTDIEISAFPAKTSYAQYTDTLDLSGAKLDVTYATGAVKTVNIEASMVSGFDNTKAGKQALTVTYGGMSTNFVVEITSTIPDGADSVVIGGGPTVITPEMFMKGIDLSTNTSVPEWQIQGLRKSWHGYTIRSAADGVVFGAPNNGNNNFEIYYVYSNPDKTDGKNYPTLDLTKTRYMSFKYKLNQKALDYSKSLGAEGYIGFVFDGITHNTSDSGLFHVTADKADTWVTVTLDLSDYSAYNRDMSTLNAVTAFGFKPFGTNALPSGAEMTLSHLGFFASEEEALEYGRDISVDIDYEDFSFEYKVEKTWDAKTHTYTVKKSEWVRSAGYIELTNGSGDDIEVTFGVDPMSPLNGIGAVFNENGVALKNNTLLLQGCLDPSSPDSVNILLDLLGETNKFDSGTVGSVTLTLNTLLGDGEAFPIFEDGRLKVRIVCENRNDLLQKEIADLIAEKIYTLVGQRPSVYDDYVKDNGCFEILVGKTNRDESYLTDMDEALTSSYGAAIVNNKFPIVATDRDGYYLALTFIEEMLMNEYNSQNNELIIDGTYSISGTAVPKESYIQSYQTAGTASELYDCGDDGIMSIISATSIGEFNRYLSSLSADGNTLYAENTIGNNSFATYVTKDKQYVINASFTPADSTARLIIEPLSLTSLPDKQGTADNKCDVTFTQIGLEHIYWDATETPQISNAYFQAGMSYVIRLSDGRFIVIDGGLKYDHSYNKLISTLKAQALDPNNITVAAWIISHAHDDHTGVFEKFAADKTAQITVNVESFIYNFPSDAQYTASGDSLPTSLRRLLRSFDGTKVLKAHPGQRIHIADAVIEIYNTVDLQAPAPITDPNAMSMVFAVHVGGQKIMFTADMPASVSDQLVSLYGSALKSDIVQATHHGGAGASVNEFYKLVDPSVVLFPTGEWDYHYYWNGTGKKGYECNAYFYTSENVKHIIVAGSTDLTLTLPYLPAKQPLPAVPPQDSFQ